MAPLDPIFPGLGTASYDVRQYTLALKWDPATHVLDARTTIAAVARDSLRSVSLDYSGPPVVAAAVDGTGTTPHEGNKKLVLPLPHGVNPGDPFTAVVHTHGRPGGGGFSVHGEQIRQGWIDSRDGGTVTLDEPNGAHTWFPCNDHPSDKAIFAFRVTAPSSLTVVANGVLSGRRTRGHDTTWTYREPTPMATYLAQVVTGRYVVQRHGTVAGVRLRNVLPKAFVPRLERILAPEPRILIFLSKRFGVFPFDTYGGLVVNGYPVTGLETQTLTTFSMQRLLSHGRTYDGVVQAHEMTHQWFGDAVSPATWRDIWLNEGFATYGQWLWEAEIGGPSPELHAREVLRRRALLARLGPTAMPAGPGDLFGDQVYSGGALALQALRDHVGASVFFRILRSWYRTFRGRSASTAQFIGLASRVAGEDLEAFLHPWLYSATRPSSLPG